MLRILFMGTPDFATACLKKLVETGNNIVGVVTQPDKAMGRGMKTGFSDVKKYALEMNLPIFQPTTLKDNAFLPELEQLKPDVIVVVAYGKILPEYVLSYPKYGCVNVHGSLLPKYRGAAPIQRAVMNGDKVTGVTTMLMDKGLDTGDMLLKREYEIGENENVGQVFDNLALIGAELLLETLDGLEKGTLIPEKQDEAEATHTEKISNEECELCFDESARSTHNKIRALSPFPGAFCRHNGKILKIYESFVLGEEHDGTNGEIVRLDKQGIYVKCGKGTLVLTRLKPEGKGIMNAADHINGTKVSLGEVLGK